ncbi:MAG: CaiB/BaiF CoA-transferase family protein [Bosea sp. (in: a-proteobacteria)]|uniref:CaiB/BaiF CoA transferase family protein n=1 Tax=Bosea sp. (in: a-proteobacteria) TaxID=1871050 RepID=UPI002733863D|nr:CaiB/BaiF CoA-transferase family protein [Bosea sp. (in: a-proteobacteria)]MDP3603340.1 CaiB/BaiF CoA-transferase family protein [Bosea sp. (in: a-proteobacteria)]
MLPLDDLTVLDFSTLLPGPMASLFLAEAGARIIRIERPGGEEMRRFPPRFGEISAPYAVLNRGKASVEIDLKALDALARLTPLIEAADILIEQFRPGVMERLGFGYEALSAINPRLIYCSISGYGQFGPRAQEAGHDINYQAVGGLLGQSLRAGAAPPLPPPLVADIAGGTMPAVLNILLALRQRERSGQGCHLDIAMTDAMPAFAWYGLAQGQVTGRYPEGGAGLLTGGSPRYGLYATQDGWFLAVGALEPKFWEVFCEAIGLSPALRDDRPDPEATRAAIAAIIAGRPAGHWRETLEPRDCCCTVVRTLEEAVADPHATARGLFDTQAQEPGGRRLVSTPLPLAPVFREKAMALREVAASGADTERLLG